MSAQRKQGWRLWWAIKTSQSPATNSSPEATQASAAATEPYTAIMAPLNRVPAIISQK